MKQESLFIIRTCPICDSYQKNFSSYWSFERLLQERTTYLQSLQEYIRNANYDLTVRADAAEIVAKHIQLCLILRPTNYLSDTKFLTITAKQANQEIYQFA
jgi:hypothetical protein